MNRRPDPTRPDTAPLFSSLEMFATAKNENESRSGAEPTHFWLDFIKNLRSLRSTFWVEFSRIFHVTAVNVLGRFSRKYQVTAVNVLDRFSPNFRCHCGQRFGSTFLEKFRSLRPTFCVNFLERTRSLRSTFCIDCSRKLRGYCGQRFVSISIEQFEVTAVNVSGRF